MTLDAAAPATGGRHASGAVAPPATALVGLSRDGVRRWSTAVVLVAVLIRAWATFSGGLYWDDFIFQGRAARLPLDWAFLSYDHDGHFMPLGMLLVWVTARAAPLAGWLPALTVVVLYGWWLLALRRLLFALFGARPLALVPLALAALSVLTLPSGVWWAAAINLLPLLLAMTWAARAHVASLEGSGWPAGVATLAATAVGLGFTERGIFIPLVLFGLSVVLAERGPLLGTLGRVLYRQWVTWFALFLLLAGYIGLYASRPKQFATDRTYDWSPAFEMIGLVLTRALPPALVGGPLRWTPTGYAVGLGDPPTWLVWLSVELLVVGIVVASALRFRAGRAWLLVLAYLSASMLGLAVARVAPGFTALTVLGYRYTADATVVIALAVAFSLMPLRTEQEPDACLRVRALLGRHRLLVAVVALILVNAMLAMSLVSTNRYVTLWTANPAKSWLATTRATLAEEQRGSEILDQRVPEFVLWRLSPPYERISWALAGLPQRPRIVDASDSARVIDTTGHLVDGDVRGVRALPGPNGDCGWGLRRGGGQIGMSDSLPRGWWTVRIDYLAGAASSATLRFGGASATRFDVDKGLGVVFVTVEGEGGLATISGLAPGVGVCVSAMTVGDLVPATQMSGS